MAFFEQTNNEQADNSLWTESYRPTRLEDYVGIGKTDCKIS